jgi:hypothetical protein
MAKEKNWVPVAVEITLQGSLKNWLGWADNEDKIVEDRDGSHTKNCSDLLCL